jgi:hypothetical protein
MRCYYMRSGRIASFDEIVEYASDEDAIAKAHRLFASRSELFDGFELWQRTRVVYRHSVLPMRNTPETKKPPGSA